MNTKVLKNIETISNFEKLVKERHLENYEKKLKPLSYSPLYNEIEISHNEIRNGQFTTSDDLEKEIEKW